jgi:hypothetical protein
MILAKCYRFFAFSKTMSILLIQQLFHIMSAEERLPASIRQAVILYCFTFGAS